MRKAVIAFMVIVSVLLFEVAIRAACKGQIKSGIHASATTLTLPFTVLVKVASVVGEIQPKVIVEMAEDMEFSMECRCSPCCKAPDKQKAALTVSASMRAFGTWINFRATRIAIQPGKTDPAPTSSCELDVWAIYEKGTKLPRLAVDYSIGGWSIGHHVFAVNFTASEECECVHPGDPCGGNGPPVIVKVSPRKVDVTGESAIIRVYARDMDGNSDSFASPEGEGLLTATEIGHHFSGRGRRFTSGAYGVAEFRIDRPAETDRLDGVVEIEVWDTCGEMDSVKIPVHFYYPPRLIPLEGGWKGNRYIQDFEVDDPDFKGCSFGRTEYVDLTAKATCGEVQLPPVSEPFVSCNTYYEGGASASLAFIPHRDCCNRRLTLIAEDAEGQEDPFSMSVPDRSPAVSVEPSEIAVKPGERVSARVTATDPDGDTITLERVSGPGTLEAKGNAGKAIGSYSWTAAGHGPWKLTVFEATDPCGAAGRSYLLIHILQPPRA